jgi:hypothetical protein
MLRELLWVKKNKLNYMYVEKIDYYVLGLEV